MYAALKYVDSSHGKCHYRHLISWYPTEVGLATTEKPEQALGRNKKFLRSV